MEKTATLNKNQLMQTTAQLSQKLFNHPTDTVPTRENPINSPLWQQYIDSQKKFNKLFIEDKYKVVAIVITKEMILTVGKGFFTSYFQDVIRMEQNYEEALKEIVKEGRTLIEIVKLID